MGCEIGASLKRLDWQSDQYSRIIFRVQLTLLDHLISSSVGIFASVSLFYCSVCSFLPVSLYRAAAANIATLFCVDFKVLT
jgi:hypothetical protein